MQPVVVVNAPAVSLRTTYSAGSALSQGLSIWSRNVIFFLGVSFLAQLPFSLVPRGALQFLGGFGLRLLIIAGSATLTLIVQGLVTYSVLEQLRGRTPSIAEAVAKTWSRAKVLVAVAFTTGILLLAAGIALVVPAVVLSVHWAVVSQVVMAEGDVDARRRSEELTAGHRWSIFGVMALFWAASFGLKRLAATLVAQAAGYWVTVLGLTLASALVVSVSVVVYSVIYYQLRSEKEGVDIEQLTSVFR